MIKHLLCVCPFLLSLACNDKGFKGEVVSTSPTAADSNPIDTSGPRENAPEENQPAIGQNNSQTTPVCDAGAVQITQARLISTGIDLTTFNQTLKYELSVVNCADGTIVPIKDQILSFDLNLIATEETKGIGYAVSDAGTLKPIASGMLDVINGSDLFGHRGRYFHWETKKLGYSSNADKVLLDIVIKDQRFKTNLGQESAVNAESYLKIGNAAAVTQNLRILKR